MSTINPVVNNDSHTKRVELLLAVSIALNFIAAVTLRIFGSQMYPFFVIVYVWIACYVVYLTLLLRRERIEERPILSGKKLLFVVAVIVLGMRLIFLNQTDIISLDSQWYLDFGKFMQMGELPYSEFYFPYPPVFAYVIFGLMNIYPSIESFRIFASVMDLLVAFVIFKIVQRYVGERWAPTAVLAYAMLPISIIESGWNGHFEPLASLFLLVAVWFLLEKKYCFCGIAFGLAIATKIYPVIVLPILLFYTIGRTNKIKFLVSTLLSIGVTYIPLALLSLTKGPVVPTEEISTEVPANAVLVLLESFFRPDSPMIILTTFVFVTGIIGMVILLRPLLRNELKVSTTEYYSLTLILGAILITLGLVAGIYPLHPISRTVYWRYPADVGVVRGISSIGVGILVIISVMKGYTKFKDKQISLNSFLVIGSAMLLLLLTISRNVFYGWYLLWSIPIFLLMKDRRLGWIVLLGLLLIYPSYTHDNFDSLGFEETRQWSDELDHVAGWSSFVNVSSSGLNSSLISSNVTSVNGSAIFFFDTTRLQNETYSENISIVFTKDVDIEFVEMTDFVSRITTSWDPTFGRHAEVRLSYAGVNPKGQPINGIIIDRPGIFTNLTYILWRFSFSTIFNPDLNNGSIQSLTLTIFPLESVRSSYVIDYFYTTHAGPLNPVYFLMIPSLISLALVSYIFLDSELRMHEQHYE